MTDERRIAFALAAHPDDIEFMMAGTFILLGDAGYELHYMTLTNGSCGTTTSSAEEIAEIRTGEAKRAAGFIGATYHPSWLNDLEIFFDKENLARLAAVMREVNPSILLVQSPEDYMEDHMNAQRLAVTAAFAKGLCNFPTLPATEAVSGDMAIYHALPHGLHDGLARRVHARQYVDITGVLEVKREMLAQHASQKEWLDHSQGMDSYLITMEKMCADVGEMSNRFQYAEGWRRHNHLGYSVEPIDPLSAALGESVLSGKDGFQR